MTYGLGLDDFRIRGLGLGERGLGLGLATIGLDYISDLPPTKSFRKHPRGLLTTRTHIRGV